MDATLCICPDCNREYRLRTFACGSIGTRCTHCGCIKTPKNWLSDGVSGYYHPPHYVINSGYETIITPSVFYRPLELRSVDDYNDAKRKEREERERKEKQTGVACPKCGKELEWRGYERDIIWTIREALCKPCGLTIALGV